MSHETFFGKFVRRRIEGTNKPRIMVTDVNGSAQLDQLGEPRLLQFAKKHCSPKIQSYPDNAALEQHGGLVTFEFNEQGQPWNIRFVGETLRERLPGKQEVNPGTQPFKPTAQASSSKAPSKGQQQDGFVYPYNFVRLGDPEKGKTVNREQPPSHAVYDSERKTGKITITITPKSPWCLKAGDPYACACPKKGGQKMTEKDAHNLFHLLRDEQGNPELPITSLKGMLSTTVEGLTDSALRVFSFEDTRFGHRYNPKRRPQRKATNFIPAKIEKSGGSLSLVPMEKQTGWVSIQTTSSGRKVMADVGGTITRNGASLGKNATITPTGTSNGWFKRGWELQPTKGSMNWKHDRVFLEPFGAKIPIPAPVVTAYNDLIDRQKQLLKGDFKMRPGSDLHHLRDGDLVYYRQKDGVLEISRVSVPLVGARNTVGELLPEPYHPPQTVNLHTPLDPATRLFGAVSQKGPGAYRGNIRIASIEWHQNTNWDGKTEEVQLKPLSGPSVQSSNLYLSKRNREKYTNSDEVAYHDSKDGVTLRGRKRYWVHEREIDGSARQYELKETTPPHANWKSNQNITAELLPPDAGTFKAEIFFQNPQDWELGALLFALELPWEAGHGYHQIGHGKPLGLGACQIEITDLQILDPKARYGEPFERSGWSVGNKKELIQGYQEKIKES